MHRPTTVHIVLNTRQYVLQQLRLIVHLLPIATCDLQVSFCDKFRRQKIAFSLVCRGQAMRLAFCSGCKPGVQRRHLLWRQRKAWAYGRMDGAPSAGAETVLVHPFVDSTPFYPFLILVFAPISSPHGHRPRGGGDPSVLDANYPPN